MPITFQVAKHKAREIYRHGITNNALDGHQVVSRVWHSDGIKCTELLQSSYQPNENFVADRAGFVNCVKDAYNNHHHLIIRPDDIWTSILSQMNLYVNAHAEELRSKFVAHEGKKELEVTTDGSIYSECFDELAKEMARLLKQNILDPSLHKWILPDFTTTTSHDVVISSIMMMSTLQAYFTYKMSFLDCGIPSITLLGEKADYMSILERIERLAEFGEEPTIFGRLLKPVLQEFCNAFDGPDALNHDFWSRICHEEGGSGRSDLSGWITSFTVFSGKGNWLGQKLEDMEKPLNAGEQRRRLPPLVLSGLRYPTIDIGEIPDGFCDVDVKLNDNGVEYEGKMIAGHVGYMISAQEEQMNTLQPSSHWFMFIKGKRATEAETLKKMSAKMEKGKRPSDRGRPGRA